MKTVTLLQLQPLHELTKTERMMGGNRLFIVTRTVSTIANNNLHVHTHTNTYTQPTTLTDR